MKTKRKWFIAAVVVVVAAVFATLSLNRGAQTQHFTAKVERGPINDVVEATGTINSVITVQVGSQVSGTIAKLNADFNSRVHKGDVVALIDPALFKGALLQTTADLKNAQANLVAARANLEKVVELVNEQKPDLVVITGDHVSRKPRQHIELLDTLAKLQPRDLTLSVLGNHDVYNDAEPIRVDRLTSWPGPSA